jgi:uncharacterized membrane protein YphA (DoxX/SURF4 family)
MQASNNLFQHLNARATHWMAAYGLTLLRISLGIVFFWFGALKFFPSLSPAQELASRTLGLLTFGVIPPPVTLFILATWESLIGLGFIFGLCPRITLCLLFLQMFGTLTPIFLFPHEMFTFIPYAPTLEGQYVLKNLVLISAGVVLGGTLRSSAVERDSAPALVWPVNPQSIPEIRS